MHWADVYPNTVKVYYALAGILNFKILRGLYSGYLKNNVKFSASFEDVYTTIVKPLFIATVF